MFTDFDEKEREVERTKREKEIFNKAFLKQAKIIKKAFLLAFVLVGSLLAAVGIILGAVQFPELYFLAAMGGFFVLLGIILYLLIPEKFDYEKYKARCEKWGYSYYYGMVIKLEMLEEDNKYLQAEIDQMNERINNLENK